MKHRSGRFGDIIMTLLLLVIGSALIYGNIFNRAVGDFMANMLVMPWVGAALGAVLILAVVLRWAGGCRKKKASYIDFQADDGSVGISTKAIQDFIERVCKEFAAVKSVSTQLIQDKGMLDIALGVKVVSGNKIPELSQVLQQRIRESVRESLGLEEIRNITIKVLEIVGDPGKHVEEDPETE
ncbi:hypothetical protein PDESU_00066 [Pontiella desulfatans]|uniref:Alkaline shock protein 23 n=1 Tax=Pontiella desulfatans TaxID=2750659 RepID=A0A6C2TVH4_PONDE|nr:alkaline shock response membrane anchor protein AmaP [Pontiella desulfatans]VGO11522.1 hypothetical protein PDESU_00066 [Pontiella desulfatans]